MTVTPMEYRTWLMLCDEEMSTLRVIAHFLYRKL